MAPQEATTTSAVSVTVSPPCSTTTPATSAAGARLESQGLRIGHQRDVRPLQRRLDADDVGVALGLDEAGNPSQVLQRRHVLRAGFDSSSMMPRGT